MSEAGVYDDGGVAEEDRALGIRYLADIQEHAAASEGLGPEADFARIEAAARTDAWLPRNLPARRRREYEQQTRDLIRNLAAAEPTSAYDQPGWTLNLQERLDEVDHAAAAIGMAVAPTPLAGTVRTRGIQATARRVPFTSQSLILVERGFFVFAWLFAKVFAQSMPAIGLSEGDRFSLDPDAIDYRLAAEPAILTRTWQVLSAYVESGHPASAPPYPVRYPYDGLAATFGLGFERFSVGHEYAHLAYENGILGALPQHSVELPGVDMDAWSLELLADLKGSQIAAYVALQHGEDLATALVGPFVFMNAIDLAERATNVVRNGAESARFSATHPPAWLRRQSLVDSFGRVFDADVLSTAMAITFATSRLWPALAARFRDLHARGVRPAVDRDD